MADGNIFSDLPASGAAEDFTELLASAHVRIERIVSHGHASSPGFWYDQDRPEWVLVLEGAARIRFEGESAPRAGMSLKIFPSAIVALASVGLPA